MKDLLFIFIILLLSLASKESFAFWPVYDNHQGVRDYQKKDYESAISHFDSAIKDSHDKAEYHYNQGNAQYRLNHYDIAEKEFLLSLNATDEEIRIKSLYNLGNVKFKQNDIKGALDYYEKALRIKPDYKAAELNRDFVKKQLEDQKNQDQDNQNKDKQDQKQEQQNKEDQKNNQDKQSNDQQKENEKQPSDQKQQNEQSAKSQKDNQDQNKENQTDKQENKDKSAADETDKKENQADAQNSDGKDETSLKERQLYRILESIGDDPAKALKEGALKEGKINRKKIERPW